MRTLHHKRVLSGKLWFLGCATVLAVPLGQSIATNPAWWTQRGMQIAHPADDFAVVNIGQLKNTAVAAYDELNVHWPIAVNDDLDSLIKGWYQLDGNGNFVRDSQGHRIPETDENTDDYAASNVGQLKAVADLFYTGLIRIGYSSARPWDDAQADDYALANLGQLKNVFSFDVGSDHNGDGVPDWWESKYAAAHSNVPTTGLDWWELFYLGKSGVDPNALAPSGDGMTLGQKYAAGLNPYTYQSGQQSSAVQLVVYTPLE